MPMPRLAALLLAISPVLAGAEATTAAPAGKPAATAPKPPPIPRGTWEAERADRLERELDGFFAEETDAGRQSRYEQALVPLQVGLTLDELQAMAKPADDAPRGKVARTRTPRQEAAKTERGWFNLSLPTDYTPAKAWPLVIALHGSSSDGDNLPSFYTPQLNQAGFIVIYPTTLNAADPWEVVAEQAEVFRLIEWAGHAYRVDYRRLVITGGSMGGMGTWSYLIRHPELWAVGASVAGHPAVMGGELMERLRGIPFYVLHGEKDTNGASMAPVEHVRQAVAEMKKRNMAPVYVEVPGAGHTPPMPAWFEMNEWIAKQAPKAWSPRPLFLPPPGQRPLSSVVEDPCGLQSDDPALALIRENKCAEARALLTKRIAQDPSRLNYLYRAVAWLPGITEGIPENATPKFFRAERGWGFDDEKAALADIEKSIRVEQDPPSEFVTTAYLFAARIHAKRFYANSEHGGQDWVAPYNAFASCIRTSLQADPANREAQELAMSIQQRLPKQQQLSGTAPPPLPKRPERHSGVGLDPND